MPDLIQQGVGGGAEAALAPRQGVQVALYVQVIDCQAHQFAAAQLILHGQFGDPGDTAGTQQAALERHAVAQRMPCYLKLFPLSSHLDIFGHLGRRAFAFFDHNVFAPAETIPTPTPMSENHLPGHQRPGRFFSLREKIKKK